MINFALTKCDFLTILVCCSDKEPIPDTVRSRWIEKIFEREQRIDVKIFNYLESELPNTSKTSAEASRIWAVIFKKQFPDHSLLITSEEYGELVARFMGIQHIAFDMPRKNFPVSATAIRNDVLSNWRFLPDSVKPDFAVKVVVLGTESTGKTTLTTQLAKHFNCNCVLETAREIIADSTAFSFEDLQLVATEHATRIDQAASGNSPLVIIDTNIYTTKSYAAFIFGKKLEVTRDIYNSNKAALCLYLNNDVEYVQDGTRLDEAERNALDLSHRKILTEHQIEVVEISGNWETRFAKAVEAINKCIYPYAVEF